MPAARSAWSQVEFLQLLLGLEHVCREVAAVSDRLGILEEDIEVDVV
ncbi:MAG: hypothetical protein R2719_02430 [Micropruina sp.]